MATNQYFNHYYAVNEQDLIESLTIESIQVQGLDVAYLPRTQENIDGLFNEDPTNTFKIDMKYIEMYPASVEGFDGEELMTMFGDEFKKSATFIVSKKRFTEEYENFIRPREGDLIFMPITNAIFEIRHVTDESPFFEKGKQYVWELKVEAFEYSYEEIKTNDVDLDEILSNMTIDDPSTVQDEFGKNEEIEDASDDHIVFNPSNPFAIR